MNHVSETMKSAFELVQEKEIENKRKKMYGGHDYKKLQSNSEDTTPDSPYKPYKQEQRSPESSTKIASTLNAFYANKEQYDAFVRLVGRDQAMLWMARLMERNSS